ncbi:MAG: hypothetical protein ACHQUB_00510 [Candidatus Saccharimonadia bacterium]
MFPHLNLSVDLVIIGTILFLALTGLALGADRMRAFALSIYVGLVLAVELGTPFGNALLSHGTNLTPGRVRLILFILPILVLTLTHRTHGRGKRHGFILPLVLSVTVAALIISSAFKMMDADMATKYLNESSLAWPIYKTWLVWLAAVPAVAALEVIFRPKKSH